MGFFNVMLVANVMGLRLSNMFQTVLPLLICLSIFSSSWSNYTVGCFIYLILQGFHDMISGYRHTLYNNVHATALRKNFQVGTVVEVDKQFHIIHCIVCLMLGLAKLILATVQIDFNASDGLEQTIFAFVLVVSSMTILSELAMLIIIGKNWEHRYLSVQLGAGYELGVQAPPSCRMARHTFVVKSEAPYVDRDDDYERLP